MKSDSQPLVLEVEGLKKHFPMGKGLFRKPTAIVKAVDGVSFSIRKGETLGLVGESGCGKTTAGRLLVNVYEPTEGHIYYHANGNRTDITLLDRTGLRDYRKKVQAVFQDPYSSLNPRLTVMKIISEPLICLDKMSADARTERVKQLLEVVGLDPRYANRFPHAFSGGQRQRIGVARALALNPDLIVADEAVTALDVSIQAQVVNLLKDLQENLGVAYLFVSHDLGVVKHISHRVAVMYVGKIVELAETETLFEKPKHPYTEALLSAVPDPDPDLMLRRMVLPGEVADPANPPPGCAFHPRCRYAIERCRIETPAIENTAPGEAHEHLVACHRSAELELAGIHENRQS